MASALMPKARRQTAGQTAVARDEPAACMGQFAWRPDRVVTAGSTSAAARRCLPAGAARTSGPSKTLSCFMRLFVWSDGLIRAAWPVSCPLGHVAGWRSTWWTGVGREPGKSSRRHRDHLNGTLLFLPPPSSPSRTAARTRSSRSPHPSFRAAILARARGTIVDACKVTCPVRSSVGVPVPVGRRGCLWCWMPARRRPYPSPPTAAHLRMGRCSAAGAYRGPAPRRRAVRRIRALVLPRTVSVIPTCARCAVPTCIRQQAWTG